MRSITAVFTMLLALTGCLYDSPLTEEHRIPIDPSILGLWEAASDPLEPAEARDRVMILKFSDTEYLIHHMALADARYYRGYPVEVGGLACMQLQCIGTPGGMPEKGAKAFIPVSYRMIDGQLEVRLINNDLIDEELKGSTALRKAFLAHKDDLQLFRDPARFRRLEKKASAGS